MKKRAKTGIVAFATASGFAVVQSPVCAAPEAGSPPVNALPNASSPNDSPVGEPDPKKA